MILSNDATALILTPVVYVLVTKLRLPILPFLFACTFIADTASFLLPVSNPINIILLSHFPLDLLTFLRLLLLPSLIVIGVNIGVFFLLYRRELKGQFKPERLPSAKETIKHRGYFRYKPDTAAHTAVVWKTSTIPRDSTYMFTMRYEVPDSGTIRLHTVIRGDSVHVELVRVARHFQLTERQFHWLSEYNR